MKAILMVLASWFGCEVHTSLPVCLCSLSNDEGSACRFYLGWMYTKKSCVYYFHFNVGRYW